jgi:hypothetical protein
MVSATICVIVGIGVLIFMFWVMFLVVMVGVGVVRRVVWIVWF